MVFGLEVLVIGKVCVEVFFLSFFVGLFVNFVIESFGVIYMYYLMGKILIWLVELFVKLFLVLICFGLAGWILIMKKL